MPHFLIIAPDRTGALEERLAHRQEHLDYWTSKPGTVKVAGAMLDGDQACGSSFLVEAKDEADARTLLTSDPFMRHGIFTGELQIIAIRPAIGEWLPSA